MPLRVIYSSEISGAVSLNDIDVWRPRRATTPMAAASRIYRVTRSRPRAARAGWSAHANVAAASVAVWVGAGPDFLTAVFLTGAAFYAAFTGADFFRAGPAFFAAACALAAFANRQRFFVAAMILFKPPSLIRRFGFADSGMADSDSPRTFSIAAFVPGPSYGARQRKSYACVDCPPVWRQDHRRALL